MSKTTVKIIHNDVDTIVSNGDVEWTFGSMMLDETVIASLVFQTVFTKFKELASRSDDFSIEFSMDIVMNKDGENDARNAILDRKILDHHFSVRSLACMKASGIVTVRDLVRHHKTDLLRFRNFGKQSLAELDDFVKSNGLEWGMEV